MRTCVLFLFSAATVVTSGLILAGCGESSTPEATAPTVVAPTVSISAAAPLTLEVGCAKCIYQVEGANDCSQVATAIDGKTLLISGVNVDAHEMGLCSAAKMASVEGAVEGGKFIASKVEVQ